jgi:acyl-CoA dehydrogenase
MFPYDDPDDGRIVLNMAVPITSEGVTVLDNWDTLGMRGTGSNDVVLEDVFVADEQVLARRPWATIDPPLQVVLCVALPVISAVYLGVAQAARDHAVAAVLGTSKADDPSIQRQVGLMDNRLLVAGWALDGALDAIGDDFQPSMELAIKSLAAKREISLAGIEVCDLALEVAGGAAFYRSSPIEQCYRDIRGMKYHPFPPEDTLIMEGKLALGLRADER